MVIDMIKSLFSKNDTVVLVENNKKVFQGSIKDIPEVLKSKTVVNIASNNNQIVLTVKNYLPF